MEVKKKHPNLKTGFIHPVVVGTQTIAGITSLREPVKFFCFDECSWRRGNLIIQKITADVGVPANSFLNV